MQIEVVRSARRRKTVQARLVEGVLRVAIPASSTREDEARYVELFRRRFAQRSEATQLDLERRAAKLAKRYDLPNPDAIRWVDNQTARWASCTPGTRTIRMSTALAGFPDWVVDYVLVHELAHLLVADHSPPFWWLVSRYPLTERARGYLIAKGGEPD